MMPATRAIALPLLLTLLAACSAAGPAGKAATARSSPDLILREQLEASDRTNALELVQALRPNWLIKRGAQSISQGGDIVVYYGTSRMGGPQTLRDITLPAIEFIQFIPGPSATQRWGVDHGYGAILVSPRGSNARPTRE